jgi:hypothetical protein
VLGADVVGQPFTPDSMILFRAWLTSRNRRRASIARRRAIRLQADCNRGINNLNDNLQLTVIQGTYTTCHAAPNVGDLAPGRPELAAASTVGLPEEFLDFARNQTPELPDRVAPYRGWHTRKKGPR